MRFYFFAHAQIISHNVPTKTMSLKRLQAVNALASAGTKLTNSSKQGSA